MKKKLAIGGALAAAAVIAWYLYKRSKTSTPTEKTERIEVFVEDAFGGAAASEGWFDALALDHQSVQLDDFGHPLITRPSQL